MTIPTFRIATFNVENLMERYIFSGGANNRRGNGAVAMKDVVDKDVIRALDMARTAASDDDARQLTALTLAAAQADIICLQEVENLDALEAFERNYLWRMTGIDYPRKAWLPGNDRRGIDVALMARRATDDGTPIELGSVTSHHDMRYGTAGLYHQDLKRLGLNPKDRVFRRDCLEVDLRIGGQPLTVYVGHFKSMGSSQDGVDGRDYTRPIRHAEALGFRKILEKRFGERAERMNWLIAGDLNDYTQRLVVSTAPENFAICEETPSGLDPLFRDGFSVNLMDRRPAHNRWTFYHASGPVSALSKPFDREVRHLVQLDYLLASPSLAEKNAAAVPDIIREGLPHRVPFPPGQNVARYPRMGWDRPKASDHCPVAVTLSIG